MFHYITLTLENFMTIIKYLDVPYTSWLALLSTNLSLFIQCNKQIFHLHRPLSNNSVHCADVWYIAWLSFLCRNVSLFTEWN